tara:strand:- start:1275 stop:1649 length:375 start_codon:yes stop_codon:yes gene_type:complete
MESSCLHCNGRLIRRLDEIACLRCGRIKYVSAQNTNSEIAKKLKNEWVLGINKDVFQVEYEVVHNEEGKVIPVKGVYSSQPYASCVKISGPTKILRMTVARERLRKNFYQSTGLRLKDLEEAII